MSVREEFSLAIEDGIRLAGLIVTPDGPGPFPGLVLCHGMPAGPQPEPGTPPPPDDAPDYPAIAARCAEDGFATVAFNFRGSGLSEGDYSPLGWASDLHALLDWLKQHPRVDASRTTLFGSSLGAAVVIYVAAHRPDITAVVTYASPAEMGRRDDPETAIARMRELGIIRNPEFPPSIDAWNREHEEVNPIRWVGRIAPRPLLLLHGDRDDLVPPESARTLYDHAGEPRGLRILEGAGHRFRREERALGVTLEWLRQRMFG